MTRASEQVPGLYRRMIGDVLVTAIHDGEVELPAEILVGVTPEERESLLRAAGRRPPFSSSINTFLLQWPDRTVLVDTGAGSGMGGIAGHLPANLAAAGVTPAEIGDIVMTHLHIDHVGGLGDASGGPAFPNATLWVAEAEIAFWEDDAIKNGVPDAMRSAFDIARNGVAPYAGRTKRFSYGEIMPGLEAVHLPGHTPGHTGFMVKSGGDTLLIWGDVMHVPAVQTARPAVSTAFDTDKEAAHRSRLTMLERAVAEDLLVTGMHLSFPGFCRFAREGDRFVLQPEVWRLTP